MKRLSGECKQFIVQSLACFMSPTHVADVVKVHFDVELTRQQVQFYDPTKYSGSRRLSQPLRDLFTTTRQRFLASADDLGVAHLRYRLECLQNILDKATLAGNDLLAMRILEQAAKEMGGWYMRTRDARSPQREAMARLLAQPDRNAAVDLNEWRRLRGGHERAA